MKTTTLSLSWLKKWCPQIIWQTDEDVVFTNVQQDSRQVTPGTLFFALTGTREDGERYITEAINKGAVAIIGEKLATQKYPIPYGFITSTRQMMASLSHRLWGEPTNGMKLIGITGTNGKTTTSFFLHSILLTAGYKTGLLGTTGYYYSGHVYPASHTTPDALVLNEHFARMRDEGITHIVMEVSSHSLVQDRVSHLNFSSAIFTNLSRDHLDFHKDMNNYREAKSLLFRRLSSTAYGIFNRDDPAAMLIEALCPGNKIGFSLSKDDPTQVYADNIIETNCQTTFDLVTPTATQPIAIVLPGLYNIYNALAAATCAWAMEIPLDVIAKGLLAMNKVPGRMQRVSHPYPFDVFVDFAHTDQALERALGTLYKIKKNRLLTVFGCGGDRDRGKRPLMGKVAEKYADYTWITNDNPRSEIPQNIATAIADGFQDKQKYTICLDRTQAIRLAIQNAQPGDIILIAGKGHENVQIIGKDQFPFSDEQVAIQCLAELQKS